MTFEQFKAELRQIVEQFCDERPESRYAMLDALRAEVVHQRWECWRSEHPQGGEHPHDDAA
jgi:hypothetical protein